MYVPDSFLLMLRGLYTVSLRSKGGHRGSNLLSWLLSTGGLNFFHGFFHRGGPTGFASSVGNMSCFGASCAPEGVCGRPWGDRQGWTVRGYQVGT